MIAVTAVKTIASSQPSRSTPMIWPICFQAYDRSSASTAAVAAPRPATSSPRTPSTPSPPPMQSNCHRRRRLRRSATTGASKQYCIATKTFACERTTTERACVTHPRTSAPFATSACSSCARQALRPPPGRNGSGPSPSSRGACIACWSVRLPKAGRALSGPAFPTATVPASASTARTAPGLPRF